ncbi:MAG: CHAP domain-containing protein [Acetobacteraceae bacterium]
MPAASRLTVLMLAALLAGCAGGQRATQGRYIGGPVHLACVPYARALSGLPLRGDASTWWRQAAGHYPRLDHPRPGSVLVFRPTARLPRGHVAVVTQVLGRRRILIDDANWVPHRVTADQPVIDVSPDNSWRLVRVYWPPAREMGVHVYPVLGFILPRDPAAPAVLQARAGVARRIALGD